jgi:hypothetical protein
MLGKRKYDSKVGMSLATTALQLFGCTASMQPQGREHACHATTLHLLLPGCRQAAAPTDLALSSTHGLSSILQLLTIRNTPVHQLQHQQ